MSGISWLGVPPRTPQGTRPLTRIRALPEPILAGRQGKWVNLPFPSERIAREPYVNRLSRHILAIAPVFHVPIDNASAPILSIQKSPGYIAEALTYL